MTENKRFTHNGIVIVDHLKKDLIDIDGDENLLDLAEYVDRLQYENEQLKKENKWLKSNVLKENKLLKEKLNEILELTEMTGMIHLRKTEIKSIIKR